MTAETAIIYITRGYTVIIDACDFERVSRYHWQANVRSNGRVYAQRFLRRPDGGKTTQALHRFIVCAQLGQIVDYISSDTTDNRRSNLRVTNCKSQRLRA